ncbi:uncharacterized protein LOC121051169 [Rosa chinensis]|uniref:uncharacterized protein LOC121051169 n=1 Tax=Rosa chinensis TaxID=74649 RepID=UPI001AD94B90|nr:uncharacterized protein LOC121051169 [Rosa chinensis]
MRSLHRKLEFDIKSVKRKSPPVLAGFTSLIMGKFLERVTATATNHTCMIIDPHNSAASEYIAEFSKPGDKVKILPVPFKRPTTEELKNQTTKSVFDLNTLNPDSYVV